MVYALMSQCNAIHGSRNYLPSFNRFYRRLPGRVAYGWRKRKTMKLFKKKQIPISDCPTSILRVFQKSRLHGVSFEESPRHRRLFPLVTWLQQLERQKWGIGHRDRMSQVLPRVHASKQSKLIVREMLRRSGCLRINRDGLVTLRWVWLKKLYCWTLKA
jgi:hypothetical protein